MPIHTLMELQYSNDRIGPFRLYIYDQTGYHHGATWFRAVPIWPEEISATEAMAQALAAAAKGLEVRITNGGDMLVYHCHGSTVLYPQPIGNFWKEICNGKPHE